MAKMTRPFVWLLAICGVSLLTGLLYIGNVHSFGFLGPEVGSEREAVDAWSYVSISLGVMLMASCISWFFVRKTIVEVCIVFMLILIAILQIPPLGLWVMIGATGYYVDSLVGILPHLVMLAMVIRAVLRGRGAVG